jgi:hypothetical protein
MKSIIINQLDPNVDIYGATGSTSPSTLIVSGWTGITYTITGISDSTVFYTVKIKKTGCDDLVKTFTFTVTPTPTATNSPTPTPQITITWEAVECSCETKVVCPNGYTLSADKSYCYAYAHVTPTEGTPLTVNHKTNIAYSNYGARIYKVNGYNTAGVALAGFAPTLVPTRPLWGNGLALNTEGRLNTVGVWAVNNCIQNNFQAITEYIGFASTINVPQTKQYYIGIAGDNQIRFRVNGFTVVEQPNITNDENFKYWHIYPVILQEGANFIELSCRDDGSVSACFGAEIYDNTEAQLVSATTENQLTIIFSTKNYFCGHIGVGTNYGYSCPAGYTVDLTDTPTCVKRDEIEPTVGNTGYVHCNGRRRLVNGVSDGYYEPNNNSGLGPYFADTLNPQLCVVGGANPTPTPTASVAVTPTPSVTPTLTPTPTLPVNDSGCLVSAVDATAQTITVSSTISTLTINIAGLQGGAYGLGAIYFAFNILSPSCRPCTTVIGVATFIKRGTLEVYELNYRITSTGGIYFIGNLPNGFLYDGNFSHSRNCTGGGCLLKGTRLTVADGTYKNIESIEVGDMLMSLQISGLSGSEKPEHWVTTEFSATPSLTIVTSITAITNHRVYQINNTVVASSEHRHFIRRGSSYLFERVDSIRNGDYLMNEQGNYVLVESVIAQDGVFETYTLDVEDYDVYFANGILTHNKELPE